MTEIKGIPHVETQIGRELLDICATGNFAGMTEEQIHAAMLGRCGVCSASWGSPYSSFQSSSSPEAQTLDKS